MCEPRCNACTSYNYCLSCKDGYYMSRRWSGTESIQVCNQTCPRNCRTCTSNTHCSSCNDGFWNNQPYNNCSLNCNPNCKACTTYNECSECQDGYYNHPESGKDCSNRCYSLCKTCTYNGNCNECYRGNYGTYCSLNCSIGCRDNACNKDTGYCECVSRSYWGERCENTCNKGCLSLSCFKETGKCTNGCELGYTGEWCDTCEQDCPINCLKCDPSNGTYSICEGGKYLADCFKSCSASCNKTEGQLLCQIENGACLNGCANLNMYGTHCEMNCSINCKENICSWLTGDCVKGCQENYWGKHCEHVCSENCKPTDGATSCNESNGHCLAGCIDGHYSVQCEKNCSINCLNTSCDTRGRCIHGCSGDFVGDSCLQVKFASMDESDGLAATIGVLVVGVVALVIIIVVVIAFVLVRRRRKDESSKKKENHHSNNAVLFSEVAERGRQTELDDCVPVYAMPDKSKKKKDEPQSHAVNNPNYQRPSVAVKQFITEKVATVYENAVFREDAREISNQISDAKHSLDELIRASKTRQSLGRYLLELEDPNENAGSSSALVLETSGYHVKVSDVGDTYYNTAEVLKRKIPLDKLAEFVNKKTRECFEEEFKLLPEGLIKKYTESQKRDNITKNRYRGIYPYEDTRVVLRDGGSDYINASFIDGYKKLKAYIASLGPTYKYMDDMSAFWRMVWQEKCGKIIMLTNLMEAGTRKCDQYWPEKDSSQLYADINVTCLGEEAYADYTVTLFNIQKDSAKRNVTQIHFTAWPDQGVPDDVTCLIEFRQRVVSVKTNLDGPILVHCSAGIGRTGTYIALDSLTKEGESEGSVDIYACVRNLREQRVNMVQTAEQYEYLHKAVVHSLTFDCYAIEANNFQQYMTKHNSKSLAQKFHDLEHSVEKPSNDENEAIKKNSALKEKNRVFADIPGDRNRPLLYLDLKPGASDYINALYVNSYRHVNRFILAQSPLPDTVDDFLTLVVQEKCSCIVNMEPETNKSKDVGVYYPADNQTLKRGTFTVRSERVSSTQNFTHRRLAISNHGKVGNEDYPVQHFQLTSWSDQTKSPDNAASFLDFIHHIELQSGGAEAGPVLVHCVTGAERCGLFCVVSILVEKIQCDQQVSVVNTVRQVKSRRHRVIPNQEQYIFCHQCVNEYIRSFDNYSNFASRQ